MVFGPEINRFCQANRGEGRSVSNMVTVRLHSTHSSQVEFKVRVSILNDFYEAATTKRSFLNKRSGIKRKVPFEVHVNTAQWPNKAPILANPAEKKPIFPDKKDKTDAGDSKSQSF